MQFKIAVFAFLCWFGVCNKLQADLILDVQLINANQTVGSISYDIQVSLSGGVTGDYADDFAFNLDGSSVELLNPVFGRFSASFVAGWSGGVDTEVGLMAFSSENPGIIRLNSGYTQKLGTLTINTIGLAPGEYSLSIGDLMAGSDAFGDFGGEFLLSEAGGSITSSGATFTITAIPEPSSFALVLVTMTGFLQRRQRSARPVSLTDV